MPAHISHTKTRARLKISGRVQGVYFRASMAQAAQKLGLAGWVRNCEDGSVEAVAEGARAAVDSLVAWSHRGPPGARVDQVDVRWEAAGDNLTGFTIRR